MKKILILMVIAILSVCFAAVSQAEDDSWTGYLSDAACAKDFEKASMDHTACAKGCVKRGDSWALAMKESFHVLEIDADTADAHAGHHVMIKGTLDKDTNTIKVSSLEMVK
jgi:opacity protein-like surface antigen